MTDHWPPLAFESWSGTARTLHMWMQIVGKVRLSATPWVNHQWHASLYPTSRGLTTLAIPHPGIPSSGSTFQLDFDLLDHALEISTSDGRRAAVRLHPRSVADFHRSLMGELDALGLPVRIHGSPNEVPTPIPFAEDDTPGEYDAEAVERFFHALATSARVFSDFRGEFIGKCSPVHLFWGAMDLAVTRFSGRGAPPHPGGIENLPDWITREAYSHEVSSAGFWPGGPSFPEPIFYSYAWPGPPGFEEGTVAPAAARWEPALSEFILPWEAVRNSADPEGDLKAFLQSTYDLAADLGDWDRAALEWPPPGRPDPPPPGRPDPPARLA